MSVTMLIMAALVGVLCWSSSPFVIGSGNSVRSGEPRRSFVIFPPSAATAGDTA